MSATGAKTVLSTVEKRIESFLDQRLALLKPESIRRYRLAARYVVAVDGLLTDDKVTKDTFETYPQRRRNWAASKEATVSDAEIEVELSLYVQALLDGLNVKEAAAAMDFAGSTLYKWQDNGFLAPSILAPQIEPLRNRRSSHRRRHRSGLYSTADITLGRELARLRDGGMPTSWFSHAMPLLRQGRTLLYDKHATVLDEKLPNGQLRRVWPTDSESPAGGRRPAPMDRHDWMLAEHWEEFQRSDRFRRKHRDRRGILNGHMKNYWLPAFGERRLAEITTTTVEAELDRLAREDSRINSRSTAMGLLRDLGHVLQPAGIRLDGVSVPEFPSNTGTHNEKGDHEHHLSRLRLIRAIYQKLKELENIEDSSQRKAEGLNLPRGAWAELVLLHFAPALRTPEALGLRWTRIVEGPVGWKIEIADKWISRNIGGSQWGLVSPVARRAIPLGRGLAEALLKWKPQSDGSPDVRPVFANAKSGEPYRRDSLLRDGLKPIARALGAPWASWDAIRETGVYFLRDRLDPHEVAELLGEGRSSGSVDRQRVADVVDELQSYVVEEKEPAIQTRTSSVTPIDRSQVVLADGSLNPEVRKALKTLRRDRRWKQSYAAEILRLTERQYNRIELGHTKCPSDWTLDAIIDLLEDPDGAEEKAKRRSESSFRRP